MNINYYFRNPTKILDDRLRPLKCNQDVIDIVKHISASMNYYHKDPTKTLDDRLRPLKCNQHVIEMVKHIPTSKEIKIYIKQEV